MVCHCELTAIQGSGILAAGLTARYCLTAPRMSRWLMHVQSAVVAMTVCVFSIHSLRNVHSGPAEKSRILQEPRG
ncbi:hypothetical protein BDW71DRAFT_111523 [Aspergillus fruticulosus]